MKPNTARIQSALLFVLHAHPAEVVITTVLDPPCAPNLLRSGGHRVSVKPNAECIQTRGLPAPDALYLRLALN